MKYFIFSMSLIHFLLGSVFAQAHDLTKVHFTAISERLQDLQPLENCLQYLFCARSHSKIVYNSKEFVLSVELSLGAKAISEVIVACHLGQQKARISIVDEQGQDLSKILRSRSRTLNSFIPDILVVTPEQSLRLKNSMSKIGFLINSFQYKAAIDEAAADLQADLNGYRIKYVPEGTFQGAVTDHGIREVQISRAMMQKLHPCELVRILRHEVEHIHQISYVNTCNLSGAKVELSDHNHRELSAHLNDELNLGNYCEDLAWMKSSSEFYLNRAQNYLKRI